MIQPSHQMESPLTHIVHLLIKLHELMARGAGDSDEADAIRDRMDAPWKRLSVEDLQLIRGLSEDLYSVGVDERRISDASKVDVDVFEHYVLSGQLSRALDFIRSRRESLDPRTTSILRGTLWALLGQPKAAIVFFEDAARWHAFNDVEELWWLTSMIAADRAREAIPRVRQIEGEAEESRVTQALALKAAEVLFVASTELPKAESLDMLREALEFARRGLDLRDANDETSRILQLNTYVHMALSYDQLGDRDHAIEACRQALRIEPEHEIALQLMGFLTFEEFPEVHRERFRNQRQRDEGMSLSSGLPHRGPSQLLRLSIGSVQERVFRS